MQILILNATIKIEFFYLVLISIEPQRSRDTEGICKRITAKAPIARSSQRKKEKGFKSFVLNEYSLFAHLCVLCVFAVKK